MVSSVHNLGKWRSDLERVCIGWPEMGSYEMAGGCNEGDDSALNGKWDELGKNMGSVEDREGL